MLPINLHIESNHDDYLHDMRLYDSKELMSPCQLLFKMLIGLAIGIALFVLYGKWYFLFVGIIAAALIRLIAWNVRRSQCREIVQTKIAQGPFDITFDENEMVSQSHTGRVELNWQSFQKVIESDKCFLLVYSKYGYVTIPKSAFNTPGQIDEFRALLDRKIL